MNRIRYSMIGFLVLSLTIIPSFAQTDIYDSGGPLLPEQAAYDVKFYDLTLAMNPVDSTYTGRLIVRARVVQPLDWFVMDLDTLLAIGDVQEIKKGMNSSLRFKRDIGKIWINMNGVRQPGEKIVLQVNYGGQPRIAPNPPWHSGTTWTKTPNGSTWMATTSWGDGADVWWPCKDHISDSPDSMGLHVTVPEPLVVATNGVLQSVQPNDNGTITYHWLISSPIDIQNVAISAAPYRVIEDTYTSVIGDKFPVKFWVLPENYEDGQKLFPEIIEHLRFFEETLGPYPFRSEKYGVVQTPYLGMEHQTIIAYGAGFPKDRRWGFDTLHHHELSHEWWGNLCTNLDWRDMWLHEGFGSYMQPLYSEYLRGREAYLEHMASQRDFWNIYAVAPRTAHSTHNIYKSPIYPKGSWILHTLRYLIGNDDFRMTLRRMTYPDPATQKVTDGSQTRYVTTDDFMRIAEQVSGQELDWFFEVYLRQPHLPVMMTERQGNSMTLRWDVPNGMPFPMPIDVKLGSKTSRTEIPAEGARLEIPRGLEPEIDPENLVLYRKAYPKIMRLDLSTLESYTGKYKMKQRDEISVVTVTRDGSRILITMDDFPTLEIFPESMTRFFFKESEHTFVNFTSNNAGKVDGLTYISGRESHYTKEN